MITDINGVEILPGQTVIVHQDAGIREAIVVGVDPDNSTTSLPGFWVDIEDESGLEGMMSYILEVTGNKTMDIEKLESKIEAIAEEVHNAWWREKESQGFHPPIKCDSGALSLCEKCHPDMIPYNSLPEHVKEYDRVTVRAVLDAIKNI